jgi:hypothetical protein
MKITRPLRGVVHLQYPSQKDLCKSLVRIQEFYESPYPEIKGKFFTLDKFEALYCADHGMPFSYYEDWHGFNFPGTVLDEFARVFRGKITAAELEVLQHAEEASYVIGTHRSDDISHELAHAMYHIDKYYRMRVSLLVDRFTKLAPVEAAKLKEWLIREGYCKAVLVDEFNAYLATNELEDWSEDFSAKTSTTLAGMGYPFRKEFERNMKYLTQTTQEVQRCLAKIAGEDQRKPYTGTTSVISEQKRGGKSRRSGTARKPSKRARASRKTAH